MAETTPALENNKPKSKRGGARPGGGRPKGSRDAATIEQKGTLSDLARSHAPAALQTLVDVATSGQSESARVTAASALLDRGYGKPSQGVELTGKDGGPVEIQSLQTFDALLGQVEGRVRAGSKD